jgi:hypothetical protein
MKEAKEVKEVKEEVMKEEVQIATIPVQVLNSVLQYLSTKPYVEVAELINGIQTEVKVNQ